ncbi:hypothetical protein D3C75_1270520 [compost metagenome]
MPVVVFLGGTHLGDAVQFINMALGTAGQIGQEYGDSRVAVAFVAITSLGAAVINAGGAPVDLDLPQIRDDVFVPWQLQFVIFKR